MSVLPVMSIFISSFCTCLGAMPVLLIKNVSHKGKDILLAFTAGIMVSASAYGLIPSALKLSNMIVLVVGILVGTLALMLLESSLIIVLNNTHWVLLFNRTDHMKLAPSHAAHIPAIGGGDIFIGEYLRRPPVLDDSSI